MEILPGMIIASGFVNTQPSVTGNPGVPPRGSRYIRPSCQDTALSIPLMLCFRKYIAVHLISCYLHENYNTVGF
jgi:hypothetical protein